MNKRIISLILIFLTFANMAFIFYNSSRTSEQSEKVSRNIAGTVVSSLFSDDKTMDKESYEYKTELNGVNTRLRDFSHMAEYFPMGLFICLLCMINIGTKFVGTSLKTLFSALIAVAVSALYALSDEVHQIFVPGRSFELSDIGRDVTGAFAGVLVALIVCATQALLMRLNNRNKTKTN